MTGGLIVVKHSSTGQNGMAQIFSPAADTWLRLFLLGSLAIVAGGTAGIVGFARSAYITSTDFRPSQPVPFSHRHHAGELGIDCRYCHSSVETAPRAGLPPTETCMTCHSQIWTNASMLEPVRKSLADGQADPVDPRGEAAGLRVLPPRRAHRQGCRLRDLPWPHRPDGADLSAPNPSRWSSASIAIAIPRRTCGPRITLRIWPGSRQPTRGRQARRSPRMKAFASANSLIATCATDDATQIKSRRREARGTSTLVEHRGAFRRSRLPGMGRRRISRCGRVHADGAPAIPQVDGRFLCARRSRRLREESVRRGAALCRSARERDHRRAAHLRDRGDVRRLCPAGHRHHLVRAPDQARRQSRSSRHDGPQRRLHAGCRARSLRSRPRTSADPARRARHLARCSRSYRSPSRQLEQGSGRGPASSDRTSELADPAAPARCAPQAISEGAEFICMRRRAGRRGGI